MGSMLLYSPVSRTVLLVKGLGNNRRIRETQKINVGIIFFARTVYKQLNSASPFHHSFFTNRSSNWHGDQFSRASKAAKQRPQAIEMTPAVFKQFSIAFEGLCTRFAEQNRLFNEKICVWNPVIYDVFNHQSEMM
jgi:hypothetical protein